MREHKLTSTNHQNEGVHRWGGRGGPSGEGGGPPHHNQRVCAVKVTGEGGGVVA